MLLEHMRLALVYPDEAVRASVCYIFCAMYSYPPVVEKLSMYFSERLCKLIISIMEAAQTKELQINTLGKFEIYNVLCDILAPQNSFVY